MKIIASAPGNIFLFGEHAAVYGYPAIIASVDRRTTVKIKDVSGDKIRIKSQLGTIEAKLNNSKLTDRKISNPELEIIFLFIKQMIENFSVKCAFEAEIESQIPVGSGMSSSTAVLCSLLGALSELADRHIEPQSYFDYIFPFQRQIHGGNASGNEIVSSSIGGINYITKENDEVKRVQFSNIELNAVIADSLVKSPTKLTVANHIPSLIKRRRNDVFSKFNEIQGIVEEAVLLLSKEKLIDVEEKQLGNLLNLNQDILDKLYLSHPKLDDCIDEARKAGALGAKLSGSGWGGIMFALATPKNQDNIKTALESTGAKTIVSKIGVEGIIIKRK
ncbi:MAG: mevalonate kinase [Candidatus Nanohalarchaeota archaeon]|nr:MAG: mevalonate kinase [Candidatus Nanohaloarchaeota archaeon]